MYLNKVPIIIVIKKRKTPYFMPVTKKAKVVSKGMYKPKLLTPNSCRAKVITVAAIGTIRKNTNDSSGTPCVVMYCIIGVILYAVSATNSCC